MSTDHSRPALDAVECLRGREREVEELPGGLTNVNLKVTTRRAHGRRTHRAARQRAARHRPPAPSTELRGRGGGGRRRSGDRVRRGPRPAGRRLPRGHDLHRRRPARRRPPRPGRRCLPPAARGPALRQRLRHVRHPARLPRRSCSERGFRLPDRYDEFEDQVEQIRRAFAVRADADRCRATTTCWPATSSTTATKLWLIDYEYSGNNESALRARQPLERGQPDRSTSSRS